MVLSLWGGFERIRDTEHAEGARCDRTVGKAVGDG